MNFFRPMCSTLAASLCAMALFTTDARAAQTAQSRYALQQAENTCLPLQAQAMEGAVSYYLDGSYRFPKTAKEKAVFRQYVWNLSGGAGSCTSKHVFNLCWPTNYAALKQDANPTYWKQQYVNTYGSPPPYQREMLTVPS